ncbi:lipoate--protein ligase [Lacrimispora sp. 210928-DFI.3.58]|uniref:lipoate--protein ligase n=1 Tax=Lacrimispora sp. 210928-DFI.3.58 TaxID=2883214 RepID=UPI001D09894E|nr:lipoate--protein ligase [Lacrimispora sp. 210928-DFI.3.58]MCB7320574.1 lipoate--protein ligase [Lacrimispora sp. 210928-DFI.3.58]
MIYKLLWIDTENTYPYKNLAMEEYMTLHVPEGTCILFLWQNRHTVVIGRNQDCWKECRVSALEEDGGYLVRRLSGGGAVFHDLGNLNFTFMVKKEDYDVDRQLQVIIEAVRMAGIRAEKTGRNDITVEGRKFSGNAFYQSGDCCYHHGTLMLRADKEQMSKYLNVSKEKLASKGVSSVKSRVANLCEYNPELTIEQIKKNLVQAFSEVYGREAKELKEQELPEAGIKILMEKFESWDWKYGRKIPFEYEMERRFPWGGVRLQLQVNEGRIQDVNVFSDAMEQGVIEELAAKLKGCPYMADAICSAVKAVRGSREIGEKEAPESIVEQMKTDIMSLVREAL